MSERTIRANLAIRAAQAPSAAPHATLALTSEERHLRRRALSLPTGERVLIDLPAPIRLEQGDRLALEDGRLIAIEAAPEPLLEVTHADAQTLARLAWHLGNRHTRVEVREGALRFRPDHVLAGMLTRMGASPREILAPFRPEDPGPMIGHKPHAH